MLYRLAYKANYPSVPVNYSVTVRPFKILRINPAMWTISWFFIQIGCGGD